MSPDRGRWLPFTLGLLLVAGLLGALVWSDGLAELARLSAQSQREVQRALSVSLQDIRDGGGGGALWTLVAFCFGYGVVHTLGPGHGKAVVVAYFLDSARPRAWIEGIFAGAWIAFTHTLAALLMILGLKLFATAGLMTTLREVRNVELFSYILILAVGLWRLWAALSGRDHHHHHHHDHTHDHDHESHGRTPGRERTLAGWLLLTAAGIAPCAGALIVVLLAIGLDVLWAGALGVVAIAAGMAIALAAIGLASMAAHRLIVGEGTSRRIGQAVSVGASLIVIVAASVLLLGALERFFR